MMEPSSLGRRLRHPVASATLGAALACALLGAGGVVDPLAEPVTPRKHDPARGIILPLPSLVRWQGWEPMATYEGQEFDAPTFEHWRPICGTSTKAVPAGFLEQSGTRASAKVRKRAEANLDRARTKDSLQAFEKLTHVVNGERRIISDPPLIEPIEDIVVGASRDELVSNLHDLVARYRQTLQSDRRHLLEEFRVVHMARKVVGVGSVGTRAWIILLLGRDDSDPLFLQAKEAQRSVLEPFTGASRFRSSGQRIVAGQHLMQASSDIFLGYESVDGFDGVKRDFYLRQLRDGKGSAMVELMDPPTLAMYATMCGRALARAHARSGDRIAIASYLGTGDSFDQAIADFSETYADQTERDYDALVAAEADGRVAVVRGI